MPELLNNTLETESLEGFMHQLDSQETEEKLSHLFARTVLDMLTLQPDGRAIYSDILWALLLEKCLLFLQQVKLFAVSITRLVVAHGKPLRGCTTLNFCLCFNPFCPQGFPSAWDWRHPHKRMQHCSASRVFWGAKPSSRNHTQHGAPGSEKEMRQPILVFKRNVLLCWSGIRKVGFLTILLTISNCCL